MNDKTNATIVYIRGIPGSGKSHVAKTLAAKLEGQVVSLDPDLIDTKSSNYIAHTAALRNEGVDEALFLYRFLRAKAYEGIENGKIIIWNQPFTNLEIFKKMTARMYEHAATHNIDLRIIVVEVGINTAIAKQRVEQRKAEGGHGPSSNTFARFANDYTSFANDGYDTVAIAGTDDVEQSVQTILAKLQLG